MKNTQSAGNDRVNWVYYVSMAIVESEGKTIVTMVEREKNATGRGTVRALDWQCANIVERRALSLLVQRGAGSEQHRLVVEGWYGAGQCTVCFGLDVFGETLL